MQKSVGILIIAGSIIFIIGAFMFAPTGYFDANDTSSKISAIENHRLLWILGFILIPIGALTVASGLGVLARHINLISDKKWVIMLSRISAIFAIVGASCYIITALMAIVRSAEAFVESQSTVDIIFGTYSLLTLSAVTMFGIVLFQTKQRILGGTLIIVPIFALISGTFVVPLTNYIPLFIAGITLAIRPDNKTKAIAEIDGIT